MSIPLPLRIRQEPQLQPTQATQEMVAVAPLEIINLTQVLTLTFQVQALARVRGVLEDLVLPVILVQPIS